MFDQRDLKHDLTALCLLAFCVFLGTSLWTHDPGDPPGTRVYPPRTEIANACGRSGAVVSALLLNGLGAGAYYTLASLAIVDLVLLARHPINVPLVRLTGWLLSLVGVTTLAAMAVPHFRQGPVIGTGGYLGATGRALLEQHFASVGAYIMVGSLILGGLLMSTDYALLRLLAWMAGVPVKGLGQAAARVGKANSGKGTVQQARRRSDLELLSDEDGDDGQNPNGEQPRAIRVTGPSNGDAKTKGKPASVAAAAKEEPAADPPKAEVESAASLLRIRKPRKSQRDEVIEEIEANSSSRSGDYELPSLDLLLETEPFSFDEQEKDVRRKAKILEKTFADFGFNIRVVEIQTGPVIAQFEVELEAGLRLSKITSLADDLAIALRVPSVRIVAPIPGKNTVGIEVPNAERQLVRLREVIEESSGKSQSMRIPIFLGKDVAGHSMVCDLSSLPHLLIAGRTGTGKSVCLNSVIVSILMSRRPEEVRMLLIDPKMVELSPYKCIPHLMHPVVTDMRKAEAILGWAVEKMEERYQLLARAGVRHLSVYNQLGEEELMERMQPIDDEERKQIPTHMPYIVILADEMADLMMTAAKEVESHIIRLAQKSRAVGIHLVLATQKPTVDVITGLIKSNLPARIAFQVASRVDSRVVLDEMGADKLLGNGDLLFLWPGTSTLIRGQGTYLGDDEINRVIDAVATSEPQYVKELVQLKVAEPSSEAAKPVDHKDDLYEQAVDLVVREGRGSCSLLQCAMGIGYGRAARLIDFMAEDGIVGAYNGSQAREVLITLADWEKRRSPPGSEPLPPSPLAPPSRCNNKIVIAPSKMVAVRSPDEPAAKRRRKAIEPGPQDGPFEDPDSAWEGEDDRAEYEERFDDDFVGAEEPSDGDEDWNAPPRETEDRDQPDATDEHVAGWHALILGRAKK